MPRGGLRAEHVREYRLSDQADEMRRMESFRIGHGSERKYTDHRVY